MLKSAIIPQHPTSSTLCRVGSRVLFLLLLADLLAVNALAQVPNDDIENRRRLRSEETITSSTTGCTVQRSCVDERLTGKCI